MNRIIPYALWIGSTGDLRDWRRLYELGIRSVIQLAYEEAPLAMPHDFVTCRFPLVDGDENPAEILELAVTTVTQLLERKFACLVCCQAGLSRSPAVAAAALARHTQQSLSVCLELIAAHHHCAIHPGLLPQIQALCQSPGG